ncbi:ATP-binding protein [Pseudonocardia sp. T1-2H]|uniref:ATP-binding protein n=1 Tax=Pseudonocardia sp. T1-2H TaxID=3128899 RepID=UPI003100CF4F
MGTAGPLEQRWPAEARVLPTVRRAVREWGVLAGLAEETVEDLPLLVSEAASNAVEHAYRDVEPGEFELSVSPGPEGVVRAVVRDFGRWRPPPADPGYRGRGLALIDTLGHDVELDAGDAGTRIAFTVSGAAATGPPSGPASWWPPAVDEVGR